MSSYCLPRQGILLLTKKLKMIFNILLNLFKIKIKFNTVGQVRWTLVHIHVHVFFFRSVLCSQEVYMPNWSVVISSSMDNIQMLTLILTLLMPPPPKTKYSPTARPVWRCTDKIVSATRVHTQCRLCGCLWFSTKYWVWMFRLS